MILYFFILEVISGSFNEILLKGFTRNLRVNESCDSWDTAKLCDTDLQKKLDQCIENCDANQPCITSCQRDFFVEIDSKFFMSIKAFNFQ